MNPKYSILICNRTLTEYENQINSWLSKGIKVFWVGNRSDCDALSNKYPQHAKALLLLCYDGCSIKKNAVIVDGADNDELIYELEEKIPSFNAAQYRVEHCDPDSHIIVEASAGTGKTTVMIDRVLYMLHTIPDIKLSDIAMITFTNEATSQMSARLQKVLLTRYRLTSDKRYLKWLEEQANMQVSTIDSFSLSMMKRCGVVAGFSQQVKIRTLNFERKELIRDILDSMATEEGSVASQFGLSYYKSTNLIDTFWNRVSQLGLDPDMVLKMNWGKGSNPDAEHFQETIKEIIRTLSVEYAEAKRANDAVTLQDLKRDINTFLPLAIKNKVIAECGFKYLFVDEFQDSDNSQIFMLGELTKGFGLRLFVVGDVKQSIYRFRGAVDSAFSRLEEILIKIPNITLNQFELINNYRTAPNVISQFGKCFVNWSGNKLLTSSEAVRACRNQDGVFKVVRSTKKSFDEKLFIDEIRTLMADFRRRCNEQKLQPNEKNRIVVLTRTNRQVSEVARVLDKYRIPAVAKRDGTFYQSDAVKDFCAFLSSFLYRTEPIYLFNYLCSPFSEVTPNFDFEELRSKSGDRIELLDHIEDYLAGTSWENYAKLLQEKPVLSVIKDAIDNIDFVGNYIARRKEVKLSSEWDEDSIATSVYSEAIQYRANVDKLLETLHQNFKSESVTVNKIVSYLQNAIATNREESEAEAEMDFHVDCVYCMTVHKAKGLEFDTVIIPFMDTPFFYRNQTEILIDNSQSKIAWNIGTRDSDKDMHNSNYYLVRTEENHNAASEETRILYVAMTRTIHSFCCIMSKTQDENCWTGLFDKVGAFNE